VLVPCAQAEPVGPDWHASLLLLPVRHAFSSNASPASFTTPRIRPCSRDEETNQTVIEGMGELHLEIIVDRLRREFKVECDVGAPQVRDLKAGGTEALPGFRVGASRFRLASLGWAGWHVSGNAAGSRQHGVKRGLAAAEQRHPCLLRSHVSLTSSVFSFLSQSTNPTHFPAGQLP
jgi:hypothetical protein